jgi:signal transduction histidine kinase
MIFIRYRYIIFTVLILFAALSVSFFIIRDNRYYISILLANLLFAVFYEKGPVQTRFFISSIILIISFLVIYTMDNFILYFFNENQDFKLASFLFAVVVSVTLLLVPFGLFFNDFEQKVIVQARKNRIAKKFPHLICAEHLTRTFMESHFIYSAAICRNDANCSSENIIVAKELIGFIGKREQKEVNDGKYYVELFNNGNQNVINGDYDII